MDLLSDRLCALGYEYRIVNASITGDTTSGGLARIERALEKHSPEIVVLELGGNDGLRGISIATMRENLAAMIERSAARGASVVLLGMRIPENYGKRYTDAFRNTYAELAGTYELPWVEFFMEGVATDPEMMLADGIHPNAEGQHRLLDNAWPAIESALDTLTGNRAAAQ